VTTPAPTGRLTADAPSGTVVFLIGARFNRLRRPRSWWPVLTAMPRMLAELQRHPELGLLSAQLFRSGRTVLVLQYWRSTDDLDRYARARDHAHLPAWREFNRRVRDNGDVGIFHETYVVPAGSVETLYGNVPPTGLAAAHGSVPRGTRLQQTAAAERMGQVEPLA
jgi:hypothetical protein